MKTRVAGAGAQASSRPAPARVSDRTSTKLVIQSRTIAGRPQETAYLSSFVFDRQDVVRFVKISESHGDRSSAGDVLRVLQKLK